MSVVGQFPGLNDMKRRLVRAPVNPMDKCTIVSIFPKEIDEYKCTIQPGRFIVPAGSVAKPGILVVGPSSWWREVDEDQPLLEIPVSSIQVADSIVRDYCNGLLAYAVNVSSPGFFYIPGEVALEKVQKEYKHEIDAADKRQRNWYSILIKLADSLWARSNGNPLAISEDMRMAAREMNQTTKDWMKDFQMVDMVRCKACGSLKNPQFPVCGTCRSIDMTHPAAKDLKFLQQ